MCNDLPPQMNILNEYWYTHSNAQVVVSSKKAVKLYYDAPTASS